MFQPELVEKLVIVDISPVTVGSTHFTMPKYFEGMMSVNLDRNIPLSKARRMADEQLSKYVLVRVKNRVMFFVLCEV
jgi:abhydrolase domain-containing protein 11